MRDHCFVAIALETCERQVVGRSLPSMLDGDDMLYFVREKADLRFQVVFTSPLGTRDNCGA